MQVTVLDDIYVSMPSQDIWLTHAHPYGFLESQGIDAQAIKNGTNKFCRTTPFVLDETPNRLYMAITVKTGKSFDIVEKDLDQNIVSEGSTDQLSTCYLISYDLTEQEMRDYNAMYKKGNIYYNFFNDAISRQKKVTIHSMAYRGNTEQINSRAILLSSKIEVKDSLIRPTVTYLDFISSNMGSGYRKIELREYCSGGYDGYFYFKDTGAPMLQQSNFNPGDHGRWDSSTNKTTIKTLEGDWFDAATYYWEMSESLRKDNWYQIDSKWYNSEETKYYDLESVKNK